SLLSSSLFFPSLSLPSSSLSSDLFSSGAPPNADEEEAAEERDDPDGPADGRSAPVSRLLRRRLRRPIRQLHVGFGLGCAQTAPHSTFSHSALFYESSCEELSQILTELFLLLLFLFLFLFPFLLLPSSPSSSSSY